MTEEERILRERWGDVDLPEGTYTLHEYAIKIDYDPSPESGLFLSELREKVREEVEKIITSVGGKLLAGPCEIDGLCMFLVALPLASVLIVDMSGAVPPGTIPGDTINQN